MKFRSPGEQPLHIGLTSGHTLVIPPEGVEVPDMFRREAISRGAEPLADSGALIAPAGDAAQAGSGQAAADKRFALIKEALRTMLNGANEEDFNDGGKPALQRLKAVAGFNITRAEADEAWAQVQAEEAEADNG